MNCNDPSLRPGLKVRRSRSLKKGKKEDEEIWPPMNEVGTLVAWSNDKKKLFG
jgi:hypothetical protein